LQIWQRVQALCLRDFFSGLSASIDEIRMFQRSDYTNHICHPSLSLASKAVAVLFVLVFMSLRSPADIH
jgi:hypothetical protein